MEGKQWKKCRKGDQDQVMEKNKRILGFTKYHVGENLYDAADKFYVQKNSIFWAPEIVHKDRKTMQEKKTWIFLFWCIIEVSSQIATDNMGHFNETVNQRQKAVLLVIMI